MQSVGQKRRRKDGRAYGWAYYPGDVAGKPAVFWANTDTVGEHTF